MNMRMKILSIFVLLLVLCTGATLAQTSSGSITGTVVDPQEAAVANATIKITEQGKSFTLTATSDGEGRFVFPIVPPGIYTITIEAAGFKKQERKDVTLVASDKLSLGNLNLEIGAPTETVTVTTEATLVQADSGERSFAIQGEQLRNTGIKTRNFISFATLAPGVIANTGAGDGTVTDSAQLSVNGVRSNSNNVQIDGVTSVDVGNNSSNSRIPLEAVGEFKLLTAAYSAEFGRSSGAQIIAVTRSGSKDFHGSAYYYRRHTGLNANTFDNNRNNRTRPISDQEEKGYTIGGPVYIPGFFNTEKNKLFFFWNQEWAPRTTPNTVRNVRVPTALERNGDFSQSRNSNGAVLTFPKDPLIVGGTCTSANTVANPGACFIDGGVLHKIPQNRWYSLGQKILSLYPLPNYTPVGSENFNYVTQFSNTEINRNDTVRIDYNFNQNWRLSGRFLNNNAADTNVYQGLFNDFDMIAGNLGIYGMSRQTPKKSFAGTLSGTLNPTTMLEITYGLNDTQYNGTTFNNGSGPDYTRTATGLTGLPLVYPNAVVDDILSGFTFGSNLGPGPNYRTQRAPQNYSGKTNDISGSLSKVWGDHVTKIGAAYHWSNKTQTNRVDKNGVINFGESANNLNDTGTGFSNALLGVYQTYTQSSSGITGVYKYFNLEPYFQDNWKVTKKLTLDYGVRFSWLPPAYDSSQNVTNFDPSKWSAAQAPRIYRPVCINGVATCSGVSLTSNFRAVDPTVLASGVPLTTANTLLGLFVGRIVPNTGSLTNGLVTVDGALANDSGVQIAPRFGFAYAATEKLIIRGGFGIFYDRPQGNLVYDFNQNVPNTFTSVFDFGLLSQLNTSIATINVPTIKAMEQNPKIPSTNSYNFGIQYKLPFDTVIDVSYVGSQGHHLPRTRQINETPYGSAFLAVNQDPTKALNPPVPGSNALAANFYRPYQGFAGIGLVEFSENSNYNSIQISADRRFSRGLTIRANYTGSLARGITSSDQGTGRFDGNDKINYGRLAFHRPHNFALSWVYELPSITKNHFVGLVTNGWQLSGLYRYQSGEPEQVSCGVSGWGGVNFTGSSSGEGRCVVIGDKQPGGGDEYNLYNYRAFAAPMSGGTGIEATRDQLLIKAPPIDNWDLSLSKKFFIWETIRIEARLDAFNALNHTQVGFINFFSQTFSAPSNVAGSTLTTTPASVTNRGGMGAAGGFRPNRTLQWSMRFEF